jgi:hypothetical protein
MIGSRKNEILPIILDKVREKDVLKIILFSPVVFLISIGGFFLSLIKQYIIEDISPNANAINKKEVAITFEYKTPIITPKTEIVVLVICSNSREIDA